MSQDKSFEERLARIGGSSPRPEPAMAPKHQPKPRPPKPGRNAWVDCLVTVGVVAALVFGAFKGTQLMAERQRENNPMLRMASAYLAEMPIPELGRFNEGFPPTNDNNNYLWSCMRFLPPAPEGWVRVNTWDARYPELMPTLEAIWAQNGKALKENRGYGTLLYFAERYSDVAAMADNRTGNRGLSSALYLNVEEGTFMNVNMTYSTWRDSKICADEFANQWDKRANEKAVRYPVLTRFNINKKVMSSTGMSKAERKLGVQRGYALSKVSPGLSIEIEGVYRHSDLKTVLNSTDLSGEVAMVQAALEKW